MKRILLGAAVILCLLCATAANTAIDPSRQIKWPTCGSGQAYSPFGNSCFTPASGLPADVNVTVPSITIPANTCYGAASTTTATTFTMTGVTTAMKITPGDTGDPSALNGYGATGGLVPHVWPSASNQGSYKICNTTSGSITSGAITLVMGAQ